MKKAYIILAIFVLLAMPILVMAIETQATLQYTLGEARAEDSKNHGKTMGVNNELKVGGFETGYSSVLYEANNPLNAKGSATAEVISNGYSFFYDNGAGGESHSSSISKGSAQINGSWGEINFESGSEQGNWVSIPGDLRFGYGYNKTFIANIESVEDNNLISAENKSMATGFTTVKMGGSDGTMFTHVQTYGEALDTHPTLEDKFYAEGSYGGGNTLIRSGASVQGQFSGKMETVNPDYNFIQGTGQVNLTNRYESGVGNVVRAEVSSRSQIGTK